MRFSRVASSSLDATEYSAVPSQDHDHDETDLLQSGLLRTKWTHMQSRIGLRRQPAPTTVFALSFSPWSSATASSPDPNQTRTPRHSHPRWVPDAASERCQLCLAAFSLTRRRHHCRLCGRLVCHDCAMERAFLATRPTTTDKPKTPLRTCSTCAQTLGSMANQHDPRVRELPLAVDMAASFGFRDNRRRASNASFASLPLRSTSAPPMPLPRANSCPNEFEEVLQARTRSRSYPCSDKFAISSQWMAQWLRYADTRNMSASASGSPVKAPRPGPIANYQLLDFVDGNLTPKRGLRRSKTAQPGDYHVISHEVWLVFRRLYGGGPSIRLEARRASASDDDADEHDHQEPKHVLRWIISELHDAMPLRSASLAAPGFAKLRATSQCLGAADSTATFDSSSRSFAPESTASPTSPTMPSSNSNSRSTSSGSKIARWRLRSDMEDALSNTTRSSFSPPPQEQDQDAADVETSDNSINLSADCDEFETRTTRTQRVLQQKAAVSAFAQAAAEARRKSTVELLRRSSIRQISQRSPAA